MGSTTYLRGGIVFLSVLLILTGLCMIGLAAGMVSTITTNRPGSGGTYYYEIVDHVLYGVPQYAVGAGVLIPAAFGIGMIQYSRCVIIGYLVTAFLADLGMLAVIAYHGSVFETISNVGTVTANLNIGLIFLECLAFLLLGVGIILGSVLLFKFMVFEQRYRHNGPPPPPYPMRGGKFKDRDFQSFERPGFYDAYYQRHSPRSEKVYYEKYPLERMPPPPRGYREDYY